MPTVELDIRQLADEGGTAPLAPITVTDAVLDEDGNTLTDILDELKAGLTNVGTIISLVSGVTVSGGYLRSGKLVIVSISLTLTETVARNTSIITNMPVALNSGVIYGFLDGADTRTTVVLMRMYQNSAFTNSEFSPGTYYFSGVYIAQ